MNGQIPESARTLVKQRARFRCERCGVPSPGGHWHHRRSRSVRDVHRHCPCNGVWLCPTCHEWVHGHPFEARGRGFIMSKFVEEPSTVPTLSVRGATYYDCTGGSRT